MSEIAPNECPLCGLPAYVGFTGVECINPSCKMHHPETAKAHWAESDPEDDIDTLPAPPPSVETEGHFLISSGTLATSAEPAWITVDGSGGGGPAVGDDDIKRIKDAVTQGILDLLDGKKRD